MKLDLTDKHKAILITVLISGTVLLSVFNLGLQKQQKLAAESYYEIEPEKEQVDTKVLKALSQANKTKAETNKAFNETKANKRFAQAYTPIAPPEDYIPHSTTSNTSTSTTVKTAKKQHVSQNDLDAFSKVDALLKKQKDVGNNNKSTISFSLVNREKVHIPIPIYLCEEDGKIVVNITVNAEGNVTDAYVNTSSNSSNGCLTEYALKYAKQSQFSADASKASQIGSITFHFIGKH